MKTANSISQNEFDALLGWLSDDRDEAGVIYEKIRGGLIRFFRFKGCADPLTLADETINRVARKVETFDSSKNVKTITYFYGFATNVFLEDTRSRREISWETEDFSVIENFPAADDAPLIEESCLEHCLNELSPDESALIVRYYEKDKNEKFEARKKLADSMNLKMPALHTKVFRIRGVLRECVEKCLEKNG